MTSRDYLGSAGTIVSAALVASCCLAPVLFLVFGASVGALSALNVLEPYRAGFIAGACGCWGYGFYRLYLRPPLAGYSRCHVACERPSPSARVLLWLALGVLVAALTYPTLAVRFFG